MHRCVNPFLFNIAPRGTESKDAIPDNCPGVFGGLQIFPPPFNPSSTGPVFDAPSPRAFAASRKIR